MKRVDIFSKKYYTDFHDVDEDMASILAYGGFWIAGNWPGIAYRDMCDSPTNTLDIVASRLIYLY